MALNRDAGGRSGISPSGSGREECIRQVEVAEGARFDGMVEVKNGHAVNLEREAAAFDDGVEDGLEGVEVCWRMVARSGGLE